MDHRLAEERLRYMSRGEARKLFLLSLVLVATLAYVLQGGFHGLTPAQPEVGLLPPNRVDARRALETMSRVAAEQAGEAAPVSSTVVELDPDLLQQVDDMALEVVEDPALHQLLALVHGMSEEEARKAPQRYGTFDWEQLTSAAGRNQARGRFRTLRGRFWTPLDQRVLERYPNPSGLAWVWQGTFRDQNRGYYVLVTDKNIEPVTGVNGDALEFEAAFLRIYNFQPVNTEAGSLKSLPLVVARNLRRLPQVPIDRGYPRELTWTVFGLVSLAVGFVLVYGWFSRREAARVEAWQRGRQRGRLGRVGAALAKAREPAPAPPPPACPACAAPCPSGPEVVVCGECLTRHHAGCWGAGCRACGSAAALVPARGESAAAAEPAPVEPAASEPAPVEPAASEPAPVEPAPVEPAEAGDAPGSPPEEPPQA